MTAYDMALALDAGNAAALAGAGQVHFRREEWEQAEGKYRAALAADPMAHWAMDGLARPRLLRRADAAEALDLAKAAYGIVKLPRYLDTAALAYAAMGDRESARIAANAAVRMDPANSTYRATLERITQMGEPE